jgi:hypothetical protein
MIPTEPEPIGTDSRRPGGVVASLASFWVAATFVRTWSRHGFANALADGWRLLLVIVVGGTAIGLVESRLTGRTQWWGRVAEVCVALGALFLAIAWDGGAAGLVMAGTFWAGLCAIGIAWLLLRTDVPD